MGFQAQGNFLNEDNSKRGVCESIFNYKSDNLTEPNQI